MNYMKSHAEAEELINTVAELGNHEFDMLLGNGPKVEDVSYG